MSTIPTRACVRCHGRKVRCSGFPGCQGCRAAGIPCQPYTRRKKADVAMALRDAEERVKWLESELSREFRIDCTQVPTGTTLRSNRHDAPHDAADNVQASPATIVSQTTESDSPNISLVTLNAAGEQKYLGPSSGAFFVSHAAAILRSFAQPHTTPKRSTVRDNSGRHGRSVADSTNGQPRMSPEMVELLRQSYIMWIHPLYLVFSLDKLDALVGECTYLQDLPWVELKKSPKRAGKMAMFYLIMSLGATNYTNTIMQLQQSSGLGGALDEACTTSLHPPSADALYSKAWSCFDIGAKDLHPSLSTIQILLLICIYSSYGPIGSSQWQLAGLAMRLAVEIGLHCATTGGSVSPDVVNERSSVFWTAFAIEINLSYNLGRPPSIGQEHITTGLPAYGSDTSLGIMHIKHRQIQCRIISQVYGGAVKANESTHEARQAVISSLQSQLDCWKELMTSTCPGDATHPYPFMYWERLYHGTTFVLHRMSPLCPSPPAGSLEKCLRSIGAYINNVTAVLRTSNVPLSWMLVQGVVFAGITMVITARTSFARIAPITGLPLLLADLPTWMRKCSVCLAIMNERVSDDLLSRLDADFDALADSTMQIISSGLTSKSTPPESLADLPSSAQLSMDISEPQNSPTWISGGASVENWDDMDHFLDILGMNGSQTYWEMCPQDMSVNNATIPWETGS